MSTLDQIAILGIAIGLGMFAGLFAFSATMSPSIGLVVAFAVSSFAYGLLSYLHPTENVRITRKDYRTN